MTRRSLRPSFSSPGHRATSLVSSLAVLAVAGLVSPACHEAFDTKRKEPSAEMSLGEEIFSTLCDRIGAGSISDDLAGASYHDICHKSADGWGDVVDESGLPTATGKAKEPRRLGVAKMELLARRRVELVEAFDAIFPDSQIDDPLLPGKKVRLHTALDTLMKRMTPLYEDSPYKEQTGEPYLMPASTQAMGRMLGNFAADDASIEAMARIGQRRGYRPQSLGLGAIRPLLAYPELRHLVRLLVDKVGPGGKHEASFQRLLRVVEQELKNAKIDGRPAALKVDLPKMQPSRPRGTLELVQTVMLAEDVAFEDPTGVPRYIAARDLRGFAMPSGFAVGKTLPAPFADLDGDGYSDIDAFGRFLADDGTPVAIAPPFRVAGLSNKGTFDVLDRPTDEAGLLYAYVNTSRSFVGSILRDVDPLVRPLEDGSQTTIMKALEGGFVLFGDRKVAKTTYEGAVFPYKSFDAQSSPLLDITHAVGQVIGAPESDDYVGSVAQLHRDYPEKTARVLELAWKLRDESKKPAHAKATLADTSIFWDEFALWLARVARVTKELHISKDPQAKGLLSDMTLALTHPDVQKLIGGAYGNAWRFKDRVVYNPEDVNGPPINAVTKKPFTTGVTISEPVDREKGDEAGNESAFRRFIRVIHESRGVKTCNKANAHIKTSLELCPGTQLPPVTYPVCLNEDADKCKNGFNECALFQIDDLGTFFVDSILPYDHPRRAILNIKDDVLGGLLSAVDALLPNSCNQINLDNVLEKTSGLKGLSTKPTPQALARLVFFGAPDKSGKAPVDPFITGKNKGIADFITSTTSLIGTNLCPKDSLTGVQVCTDYAQTLRGRAGDTLMLFETPYLDKFPDGCQGADCAGPTSGFYAAMRPLLTAFANYSYKPEPTDNCVKDAAGLCRGEDLFADMIDILDKHWGSANGGSSLYNYEEFLAFMLQQSDLLGTAKDLVPTLQNQAVVSRTGQTRNGLEITQSMVSYLLDPKVAAENAIVDRSGSNIGRWNNGKVQPQTTPYALLVEGLRGFDARFAATGDPDKVARWREARSTLVDQFLLAKGGKWVNGGVARALPGILDLARQQTNANCKDRETTKQCKWAREQLSQKLATVIEGPLFSAIAEFQETIREDDELRVELEKVLAYLLEQAKDPNTLSLTLASLADLLQVLHDEDNIVPLLHAAAPLARPSFTFDSAEPDAKPTRVKDPGASDMSLRLLKVMMDDREDITDASKRLEKVVDRYHALDRILPNLVTPSAEGKRAPLEVLIDVAADVNRIDSSSDDPLRPEDYRALFRTVDEFLRSDTRGMEQFYTVVRGRNDK